MKRAPGVLLLSVLACGAVACGSADDDLHANGAELGAAAEEPPSAPPSSSADGAPAPFDGSPPGWEHAWPDGGAGDAGADTAGDAGDADTADAGSDGEADASVDAGVDAAPPASTVPPSGWSGKTLTMDVSCTFTTTATPYNAPSTTTTTTTTYAAQVSMALYKTSPGTTTVLLPPATPVTRPLSRLSLKSVPATTQPSSMSWWKLDFDRCGDTYGTCPARTTRETLRTLVEYRTSGKELADEVTVTIADTTSDPLLRYMIRSRSVSVKATADGGLSFRYAGNARNRGLSTTATDYSYVTTCEGTWTP